MASPIALPARSPKPSTEPDTALAATAAPPKVETREATITFPTWNMLFSIPLGIPSDNIFFMILPSGFIISSFPKLIGISFFFMNKTKRTKAASALDMRVASPAPIVPMSKTWINKAFPIILTPFTMRATSIVTLEFPIALKSEACALYRPMNGYESAET